VAGTVIRITALLVALLALGAPWLGRADDDPPAAVLVFAAASMSDVLSELGSQYRLRTGRTVTFSFAASSALARQIEAGARADVFIAADQEWMDYLQQRGLIAAGSRRDIAGNRMVLIAPADSAVRVELGERVDLGAALGTGRLALADPDIVPAGRYARSALQRLGAWTAVEHAIARAENVRVALAYVARGEAPLGIVYETDARIEPRVRIVARLPEDTHPPIRYPAALTRTAGGKGADFLAFLVSAEARAVFDRYGFTNSAHIEASGARDLPLVVFELQLDDEPLDIGREIDCRGVRVAPQRPERQLDAGHVPVRKLHAVDARDQVDRLVRNQIAMNITLQLGAGSSLLVFVMRRYEVHQCREIARLGGLLRGGDHRAHLLLGRCRVAAARKQQRGDGGGGGDPILRSPCAHGHRAD
jgi:molybdate transport system substrate-binding protein